MCMKILMEVLWKSAQYAFDYFIVESKQEDQIILVYQTQAHVNQTQLRLPCRFNRLRRCGLPLASGRLVGLASAILVLSLLVFAASFTGP